MQKFLTTTLLLLFAAAPMAYADDPHAKCTVAVSPLPDDGAFGYLYYMKATCDHKAYRLDVTVGATPDNEPGYLGAGGGGAVCRDTDTCEATGRIACLHPGSYTVAGAVTGDFPDTEFPSLIYPTSFSTPGGGLSVPDKAHLSIGFEPYPGYPDLVQAVVSYSLPQQYVAHSLGSEQYSPLGGPHIYTFSPELPLSGKWVIGGLIPGYILSVKPLGCYTDPVMIDGDGSVSNVIVPKLSSSVQAAVSFETPGSKTARFTKAVQRSVPVKVNVPLGAVFTVGLTKSGSPLASVYTLGAADPKANVMPISTATVMPKVIKLFADKTLLQIDNDAASVTRKYIAVHLGKVSVTLLPATTTDPQVRLDIEVIAPTALGSKQRDFDTYIANVAHNTGIPPQYLKGQVFQEEFLGRMSATNYRYEPCGADLKYVSAGERLGDTNAGFQRFRLDDAIGVSLHPGVRDELDPRNVFYIKRNDPVTGTEVDRPITDADRLVTAQEIWDDNNDVHAPGHTRFHFDTGCSKANMRQIASGVLSFVAQTPTAASFGLLQVMWEEATGDDYWTGVTVNGTANTHEPKYLFDRTEYVNIGGGSVQLGANKDASNWREGNHAFTGLDNFEAALNTTIRRYNWAWISDGQHYGDFVITYSRGNAPAVPSAVFP